MKKVLIALLVATPLIAFAQPDRGSYQEHALERMEKNLELNEQQKVEVGKIFNEHREQMQALRDSTHEKINAVLNEDQRAKMANMHDQRRGKMEHWDDADGKQMKKKDRKDGRKNKAKDSDKD